MPRGSSRISVINPVLAVPIRPSIGEAANPVDAGGTSFTLYREEPCANKS